MLELWEEIVELEAQIKNDTVVLQEKAARLISTCLHPAWVWCDSKAMFLGSLPPIKKCTTCRLEYHSWNGTWGRGPGLKIDREDLYKLRYPVWVKGEIYNG